MLDAYFGFEPDRYDLQMRLESLDTYTAEEVTILSSSVDESLGLVPLLHRVSELQLNMKAKDETGADLIILTRSEVEAIYEELFPLAIKRLGQERDIPPALKRLIFSPSWADDLFRDHWVEQTRKDPQQLASLVPFLTGVMERLPDEFSDEDAAAFVFAEFVISRLFGTYRPWVQTNTPIPPEDGGLAGRAFIKYIVTGRISLAWPARIVLATLGWVRLDAAAVRPVGPSMHFRLRVPEGMVLSGPIKMFPTPTSCSVDRGQIQLYNSASSTAEWIEATGTPPVMAVRVRLNQTASTRTVAAALFGVIALLPLLNLDDVAATASLFLPLAVALVALGWERPAVRAFAVTQLMAAVALMAAWLLHDRFPFFVPLLAWGSVLIFAYNVIEGALVFREPRPTVLQGES